MQQAAALRLRAIPHRFAVCGWLRMSGQTSRHAHSQNAYDPRPELSAFAAQLTIAKLPDLACLRSLFCFAAAPSQATDLTSGTFGGSFRGDR
jgi:hypothetical protein